MWLVLKALPWRWIAIVSVLLFGLYQVEQFGERRIMAKWDAAEAERARVIAETETQQAEVTVREVVKYVDRVKVVREAGETIIKEVPVYVQADNGIFLSGGFRVLHDAAAGGSVPDPAGIADAQPVPVAAVAGTVAENYTACNEWREQLTGLQGWVAAQCALSASCRDAMMR